MKGFIKTYIRKLITTVKAICYVVLAFLIISIALLTFVGVVLGYCSFWWLVGGLLVSILLWPIATMLLDWI